MKLIFNILIAISIHIVSYGQYVSPLKIPLLSAGNFGELRSTHFHSGVDFKTMNVSGKEVLAVADGYISRVFVSPSGYGYALYITHPHLGTETVYGHLSKFKSDVAQYVKKNQYSNKKFAADLYPAKDMFPIKQGDVIAYSGNSGSSGGPHLHFEIRKGGRPQNIIADKTYKLDDNIAPRIENLYVFDIDRTYGFDMIRLRSKIATVKGADGRYKVTGDTVSIGAETFFAVEVTDRKNNVSNTFGIYSMDVLLDDSPFFGFKIDETEFATTRQVCNFTAYKYSKESANDVIRIYKSQSNKLKLYNNRDNNGVLFSSSDSKPYKINIKVGDDSENYSELVFTGCYLEKDYTQEQEPKGECVFWHDKYNYSDSLILVNMQAETLFESMFLDINSKLSQKGVPIINIGDKGIPVNNSYLLKIRPVGIEQKYLDKCVVTDLKGGYKGGKNENGFITVKLREFGAFTLDCDTVPPQIKPLFNSDVAVQNGKISFNISDNLSGIKSYNVSIDGQWALFKYDPKSTLIHHDLSDNVVKKDGSKHTVELTVADNKNNIKKYRGSFIY